MKRPLAVLVVLAMLLSACGSSSDSAESSSTTTTTTTTTIVPSSVALANRYFEAVRDGDGAAWRSLFSLQATTVQSDGDRGGLFADEDWVDDDFDADGRSSEADFLQFLYAFRAATGHQLEWDCVEVATNQAECTFVVMDVFSRLAELEAKEERIRLTEAGGLIVTMEELTPSAPSPTKTSLGGSAQPSPMSSGCRTPTQRTMPISSTDRVAHGTSS